MSVYLLTKLLRTCGMRNAEWSFYRGPPFFKMQKQMPRRVKSPRLTPRPSQAPVLYPREKQEQRGLNMQHRIVALGIWLLFSTDSMEIILASLVIMP